MKKKYICPMHPEVKSDTPGSCPKCGMELIETRSSKLEAGKAEEHSDHREHHLRMGHDFKKRFLTVLPLTIAILALSPKIQAWLRFSLDFFGRDIVLFALGSFIALWGGFPFYSAAREELRSRNFGMMTLVSLAILSGYFFSIAATFLFPAESLWWEISTLVLAFLFGHWMEMRAVAGTTGALEELAKLIPPMAHKLVGKQIKDVKTEELVRGDKVLVKPGEKVPIDGQVIDGESSVNEAMITGESRPVYKKKQDTVIGGTVNQDGSLTIEVTKVGRESAIAQIMELIRQAQKTRPQVQKLADRAANILTLTAIFVGSGTFLYWFLVNPKGAIFAATLAITVIVIACPHALGLAIPTVTTITTAIAARNGILIKDMRGLEVARSLTHVIFDKTGTLTLGEFGVTDVVSFGKESPDEVLSSAAAVDFHSQHSIGKAVVREAEKKKISFDPVKNFKTIPGKGGKGTLGNEEILVGNKAMMELHDLATGKFEKKIAALAAAGKTFVWVAKEKEIIGAIALEDVIRPESRESVEELRKLGITPVMLTGDSHSIAASVAQKLGIEKFFAEVLPEEKVKKIKELQGEGATVAMVGDGVNDAPALTQAHVGIAIGAGTDVAVEAGQIILVKNDPRDVVKVIELSRKMDEKMKQNLAWASGYNVLAIPVAAGVLFPFGILLRPEWAALLMSASSIIVVTNALLLRGVKL